MGPISFTLFAVMALCSSVSASEDVGQQTPYQPQRSSDADVQAFQTFVQEAPRTIAACRSALLSTQRREIGGDILHQIAKWTAAPDHLLEAGESISSPINSLICKLFFSETQSMLMNWGMKGGFADSASVRGPEPPSDQQKEAVAQELKRRIGQGLLSHAAGWPSAHAAEHVLHLNLIKDGDESDLYSFERNVIAEIKRVDPRYLADNEATITRTSYDHYFKVTSFRQLTKYPGPAVVSSVEFKLHLVPRAVRIDLVPVKVIFTIFLNPLKDHVGKGMKVKRTEYLR